LSWPLSGQALGGTTHLISGLCRVGRGLSMRLQAGPTRPDAPPLAPASAPGGWRATGVVILPWLRPGEEARIMRSHPPASSPLRVPNRLAPRRIDRWAVMMPCVSDRPGVSRVRVAEFGSMGSRCRLRRRGHSRVMPGSHLPAGPAPLAARWWSCSRGPDRRAAVVAPSAGRRWVMGRSFVASVSRGRCDALRGVG
jgi:hypothetical protein